MIALVAGLRVETAFDRMENVFELPRIRDRDVATILPFGNLQSLFARSAGTDVLFVSGPWSSHSTAFIFGAQARGG